LAEGAPIFFGGGCQRISDIRGDYGGRTAFGGFSADADIRRRRLGSVKPTAVPDNAGGLSLSAASAWVVSTTHR